MNLCMVSFVIIWFKLEDCLPMLRCGRVGKMKLRRCLYCRRSSIHCGISPNTTQRYVGNKIGNKVCSFFVIKYFILAKSHNSYVMECIYIREQNVSVFGRSNNQEKA